MDENREYIKNRFDSDGVRAPERLSEENMRSMLSGTVSFDAAEESQEERIRVYAEKKPRPSARKLMRAAAVTLAAAVGISGVFAAYNRAPDTSARGSQLYTFESEREIRNTVRKLDAPATGLLRIESDELSDGRTEYMTGLGEAESSEAAEAPAAGKSFAAQDSGSGSHSSTYLQVDDVDEADIVKTDGKYIYYVNDRQEVVILSAKNGKTKQRSVIGSSGLENYVSDIYLKGDTLITVGRFYTDDDAGRSGIVVYDISDRSRPVQVSDFCQSGEILTSRMVGDVIYLITSDYAGRDGRYIPMSGQSADYKKIGVEEICCVPEPQTASYIVLSAVDISAGKQGRSDTKAVFGATEDIYCNDHNLYAASYEWDEKTGAEYTRIVRAALDGTNVSFDATAGVRGRIYGRFAMDERDGYFRIATTSDRDGMDVNNLFVLDSDLNEAGRITGFARNESIRSVRFIGSRAYVITYEAIDPLFVIDLSDPEDPRIEGEVRIDGFSTLLVPAGKNRLLGIGHATGDNGYGGEYDSGLKLALFDVSDPSEPKVLDSREFENMSSPAQSDHHALTVNSDAGYFAMPYEIYGDEDDSFESGVLLFRAGDEITGVDQHSLGGESVSRSIYIGDYIYALHADGSCSGFRAGSE